MISRLMDELRNQWTPDPVTNELLENVKDALNDGKALVESCQRKRTFSRLLKTQNKAMQFDALGKRISRILELFHVAIMILIVRNRTNLPPRGGENAIPGDDEIVRLTLSIPREAKEPRQNKEEIQLLVQLVQKIATLMQQPQSSQLSRDPNTKEMLDALRRHLHDAYRIVLHNQQHRNNAMTMISQTFLCGRVGAAYYWQQPHHILKVAYLIEYYVQALPVIVMRQMYA